MLSWLARWYDVDLYGRVEHSGGCNASSSPVSPHVLSMVRYTFLNSAANAIWMYGAWSPLIYTQFPGKSTAVGWLAATNGLFEIVGATAGGWLGDVGAVWLLERFGVTQVASLAPRLLVVRAALITGLLTVWLHAVGLLWLNFAVLMVAQALYGLFTGMSLSGVEALVADLVPHGQRDRLYALKYALEASGPVAGCLLSVALFLWYGNAWSLPALLFANFVGLAVQAVSLLLLGYALPSAVQLSQPQSSRPEACLGGAAHSTGVPETFLQSASTSEAAIPPAMKPSTPSDENSFGDDLTGDAAEEISTRTTAALLVSDASISGGTNECTISPRLSAPSTALLASSSGCIPALVPLRRLPYFVVAHDTLLTVGSGFTTMYFSLFMMVDYHISPTTMALLLGSCGLCTSGLAAALGRLSPRVGRVGSIFVIKVCGTLLLLFIFVARNTWITPVGVMALVYSMRYGAMNSCSGVTRSLIMDIVPAHQRARWNAVESLQSASWSGTSVIGGYVVDRYGFGAGFLITLLFHATSCLLLVPCLATEDRPGVLRRVGASAHDEVSAAPQSTGDLTEDDEDADVLLSSR